MKRHLNKIIACSLALLAVGMSYQARAEKYRVQSFSSSNISIGGTKVHLKMNFDDNATINWGGDDQYIEVISLSDPKATVHRIQAKKFNDRKIKTLGDFFSGKIIIESSLSTGDAMVTQNTAPVDSALYMIDMTTIDGSYNNSEDVEAYIRVNIDGETVLTKVERDDNNMIVLDRRIFGFHKPQPVYIDIIEWDTERDWIYYLYRNQYLVPVSKP